MLEKGEKEEGERRGEKEGGERETEREWGGENEIRSECPGSAFPGGRTLGVRGRLVSWISEPNSGKWQNFPRTSWHYPGGILERTEEALVWTAGWRESSWGFMHAPQAERWQRTSWAGSWWRLPWSAWTGVCSGHSQWSGPPRSAHCAHPTVPEASSASRPEPWPQRLQVHSVPLPPVMELLQRQVSSPGTWMSAGEKKWFWLGTIHILVFPKTCFNRKELRYFNFQV